MSARALAITSLLLLAYGALVTPTLRPAPRAAKAAVICVAGDEIARLQLPATPRKIRALGPRGYTIVELNRRAARIVASPCSRKICIRRGWLRRPGERAVCLPNRVVLRLE